VRRGAAGQHGAREVPQNPVAWRSTSVIANGRASPARKQQMGAEQWSRRPRCWRPLASSSNGTYLEPVSQEGRAAFWGTRRARRAQVRSGRAPRTARARPSSRAASHEAGVLRQGPRHLGVGRLNLAPSSRSRNARVKVAEDDCHRARVGHRRPAVMGKLRVDAARLRGTVSLAGDIEASRRRRGVALRAGLGSCRAPGDDL
jgi:hypothetical protein